jgi:hypothetical protein
MDDERDQHDPNEPMPPGDATPGDATPPEATPPENLPPGAVPSEGGEAMQPGDGEPAAWPREDRAMEPAPRDEPAPAPAHEPPPSDVEAYGAPPDEQPSRSDEPTAAHTVPATGVGESTQCPRCGTENRPGLAFCRNCGQRLVAPGAAATLERPGTPEGTQACPRCGTHNRAGVAFCQNCGANLRGAAAAAAAPGYVPPAVEQPSAGEVTTAPAAHAILGPIVLLIGAIGLVVAWLLPFLSGGSLYDRATGSGGYSLAFWNSTSFSGGSIADQIYYALAALAPILVLLLLVLAIAGFVRAAPGVLQSVGLVVALLWAIALVVLFVVVELLPATGGELTSMLRALSPAGIIFLLASLIVVIGTLTRFGRS